MSRRLLARRLDPRRGHAGGLIRPHRAIRRLELAGQEIGASLGLALLVVVGWAFAFNPVARLWHRALEALVPWLGLDGAVAMTRFDLGSIFYIVVPYLQMDAGGPSLTNWMLTAFVCGVLLLLSFLIPRRYLPLAYFLRLVLAVQASALLFFVLAPGAFPYNVAGYTEVLYLASLFVIGLVPVVYGVTFYTLDFSWPRKLALTFMAMGYLCVFVPIQYLTHAVLIQQGSLLFMPMLFWTFGLPLNVGIVVAMFSWGASWETVGEKDAAWAKRLAVAGAALVFGSLLLGACDASAQERDYSVQGRLAYGEYSADLGESHEQAIDFTTSRPWLDDWRFSVGHASRFGDDGFGFGVGYGRHLRRDTRLTAGLSTGTGDVIFPDLRFDVGLDHGLGANDALVASVGYTRIESKAANYSDGYGAGLRFYSGPWIASAFGRIDIGQPGDTTSRLGRLGLTYGRYRSYYLGVGYEKGEVSYLLVGPDDALADFGTETWEASATVYAGSNWGFGAKYADTTADFYDLWTATLSGFYEW